MYSGPSGFQNAPITKVFLIVSSILSFLLATRSPGISPRISYETLYLHAQWWRLPLSLLAFSSTSEAIFGLLLLYFFRLFERQLAAPKFAVLCLFSSSVSLVLQLVTLLGVNAWDSEFGASWSPSSGPYGLLFSLFVLYAWDVPVTTRFVLFSRLHFSDKTLVYLAGLQLLLSSGSSSLLPSLYGMLAGLLYQADFLTIRQLKFSDSTASTAALLFRPLLASPQPPAASQTTARSAPTAHGRQGRGTAAAAAQRSTALPTPPVNPSESAVAALESMGFNRPATMAALMATRNDVEAATHLLLEQQQHQDPLAPVQS